MRDRDRAHQQLAGYADFGQQHDRGPYHRDDPDLAHLGPAQLTGLPEELRRQVRATAERLEHPDAERRLLHRGGQITLLVLGEPGDHLVLPLEDRRYRHQRHRAGEHDRAEAHVQGEQHHQAGDQGDRVHNQEDADEDDEPAERGQVRDRPGQQLAGLPAVVEGGGQPLQVGVEVAAHGRLGLHGRPGHHLPAQVEEPGLGQAEAGHAEHQPDQPVGGPVRDRAVQDALDQQGDDQAAAHRAEGGQDGRGQILSQRPYVRPEPGQ
ncbi:hypothetical protein GCM10029964_003930 [Kibdelosporangium lantanae]